jgi:hypothetical protein
MVSQNMEAGFDMHRPMVASRGCAVRMGAWPGLLATNVSRPSTRIATRAPLTE